jgi:hypothetical protein
MTSLRRGIALSVLGLGLYTVAVADEPKFKGTVLDQVPLGGLNGDYIMKVTMLDMEPGAQIPEHTHKGPGLRYVSPHRSDVGEERRRRENARPHLRAGPEGIIARAED